MRWQPNVRTRSAYSVSPKEVTVISIRPCHKEGHNRQTPSGGGRPCTTMWPKPAALERRPPAPTTVTESAYCVLLWARSDGNNCPNVRVDTIGRFRLPRTATAKINQN